LQRISLGGIDYAILIIYFVFVLGIGWALRRVIRSSDDFFLSGRSIPAWIAGLAFISANLGAQEVIGMAASGAKYGIMTSHFYWVGAMPAMVFVGLFMMPFYYGSRARSVPEYLKLRFDEKTRGLNAMTFAVMTIFSSGISMYALAKLLELVLGWSFHASIILTGIIVLVYIFLGGLRSAIYNEVLQFFLIVLGFLPLVLLGLKDVGGWHGLTAKLATVATNAGCVDPFVEVHGLAESQSDGDGVVRVGDGVGIRAVVRLLVHGLSGGAAGDGRRLDDRGAPHAVDRGRPQDADAGAGDSAGHARDRAACLTRRLLADRQRRPAELQPRHPDDAGALPAVRAARPRAHRADGVIHVGDGGQCHRVQQRVDLRHLPVLHPAGAIRRALSPRGACGDGVRDLCERVGRLLGDALQ